jgi:hypothetical protein
LELLSKELERLLMISCKRFVQHALDHILIPVRNDVDIVQSILNVQGAIEVISKVYHLRNAGWKAVVDNRHHDKTEGELLEKLCKGELRTKPYWKSKEYVETRMDYFSEAKPLLKKFQHYRNSIAHLGLSELPEFIDSDILEVLIRVINTLNWDASMPNGFSHMDDSTIQFIGDNRFKKLLKHPDYIELAEDKAHEVGWVVHKCFQCKCRTWARTDLDELLCCACGYRLSEDLVEFEDCNMCESEQTLMYDKNQGHGHGVTARCTECNYMALVASCHNCGNASEYVETWECRVCESA